MRTTWPPDSIRSDADEAYPTLEPQMLEANNVGTLNGMLGTSYGKPEELIAYTRTVWCFSSIAGASRSL